MTADRKRCSTAGTRSTGPCKWALVSFLVFAVFASLSTVSADTPQRTTLVLYPYHGLAGLDATALSSDLEVYLVDKVRTLYAFFAREPTAKYMSTLHVQRADSKPTTVDGLAKDWQRLDALLLLDGVIAPSNGSAVAKSSIFFGELGSSAPGAPVASIHLDLPLRPDQFGTIVDTHSAAALYGLALDARRNGMPKDFYVQIAARALDVVYSLDTAATRPADLAQLQCGLLLLISEATGVPAPAGC